MYNLPATIPAIKLITVSSNSMKFVMSTQIVNYDIIFAYVMTNILGLHEDKEIVEAFKYHRIIPLEDMIHIPDNYIVV